MAVTTVVSLVGSSPSSDPTPPDNNHLSPLLLTPSLGRIHPIFWRHVHRFPSSFPHIIVPGGHDSSKDGWGEIDRRERVGSGGVVSKFHTKTT